MVTAMQCPACGHEWDVELFVDRGTLFPVNQDAMDCPECGVAGEEK